MEAQAWTAIGLLAATLAGWLYFLIPRIKKLEQLLDEMDGRIDALEGRIDELTALPATHMQD
jgi:hypothetical protein